MEAALVVPSACTPRPACAVRPPAGQATGGDGQRLLHLDALRGLAAAVVVAHHALLAMSRTGARADGLNPLNILLLGRPAVILFFVLSGFVLTLHLVGAKPAVLSFAARRLVRLMVPFATAIGFAAAAYRLTGPHRPTGLSDWFDSQWSEGIGALDLLRHVAMLAGPRQYPLDHVAWSLVHELRLSLALPLFLMCRRRFGTVASLAAAGGLTLLADGMLAGWPGLFPAGIYGLRFDAQGLALSLVLTARFCLAFALGAVLATHGAFIRDLMRRRGAGLFGLIGGLSLLSCRNETMMAMGATLLIAAAAWAPALVAALRTRPLVWMGRISFSLYLVHLPTMLACVHACPNLGPAWVRLLVGLGLALPIAALMTAAVEDPAIVWSRVTAQAVSRAISVPPGRRRSWRAFAAQRFKRVER